MANTTFVRTMRKFVIALLLTLFLSAVAYLLFSTLKPRQNAFSLYDFVPISSDFIIQVNRPTQAIDQLLKLEALSANASKFSNLQQALNLTATLDTLAPKFLNNNTLEKLQVVIANVPDKGLIWILLIPQTESSTLDAEGLIQLLSGGFEHENIGDFTAFKSNKKWGFEGDFYTSFHGNIALAAADTVILKSALAQAESGLSLLVDEEFVSIRNTDNTKNSFNLFINPNMATPWVQSCLANGIIGNDFQFRDIAAWLELDAEVKQNALRMNGFTNASDSLANFVSLLAEQQAMPLELKPYLLSNAAFISMYSLNNMPAFATKFEAFQKGIPSLSDSSLISAKIFRLVDGHFARFAMPAYANAEGMSDYVLIKLTKLSELKKLLGNTDTLLNNETIYQFPYPDALQQAFAMLAPSADYRTFVILNNNYVLFAPDEAMAQYYLSAFYGGKTVQKDPSFLAVSEQISSSGSYMFYASPRHGSSYLMQTLGSKLQPFFTQHSELFKSIETVLVQLSFERQNLYYINGLITYNDQLEQNTSMLWEQATEKAIHAGPFLFKNHYTQATEIIVQDSARHLYLFAENGELIWKTQLDGLIFNSLEIVDMFNNGKFQALCNTEDELLLLDRNGKMVEGYPIKFAEKANAGLQLMDYDNNKQYRVLVPTQSGNLLNFDINGKAVKGWNFKPQNASIQSQIYHHTVGNKDYILTVWQNGKVSAVGRNGEERLNLQSALSSKVVPIFIAGKTLEQSYFAGIDADSNLILLNLKDELSVKQFDHKVVAMSPIQRKKGKPDLLLTFKHYVENAFDTANQVMFEVIDANPTRLTYQAETTEPMVVFVNNKTCELEAIKTETNRRNLYAMPGCGAYIVKDLNNDGVLEAIMVVNHNQLIAYSIL